MSLFSRFVSPSRKGARNFERARRAELRRDFDKAREYFRTAAEAFDAHFATAKAQGKPLFPSHLVMAGICYTRLGRNEDALRVLDDCMAQKEIPDAFLHAGFAAAKMNDGTRAANYWSRYPKWAAQPHVADALSTVVAAIRHDGIDLQEACETVVRAAHRQDKANAKGGLTASHNKPVPKNRGY